MANRGPRRPKYDEEDRPFRVAALELMMKEHLPADRAAKRAGTEELAGGGTLASRQRRLQRWLKRHSGSRTAIELAHMYEQIILKTGMNLDYSGALLQKAQ
jgi:hypothetical protein